MHLLCSDVRRAISVVNSYIVLTWVTLTRQYTCTIRGTSRSKTIRRMRKAGTYARFNSSSGDLAPSNDTLRLQYGGSFR
jgi:hypothetical protein